MRVMLVDDEMLIVEGLKKIIKNQYSDIETVGFTNPFEALSYLKKNIPDLLITDIRMPGITGLELIEKARDYGLKYYAVLSGLDDVPLIQKSIRLEVSDYLIKPVNKQELFSLINSVSEKCAKDEKGVLDKLAKTFSEGEKREEVLLKVFDLIRKSENSIEGLISFAAACHKEMSYFDACRLYTGLKSDPKGKAQETVLEIEALPEKKEAVSKEVVEVVDYVLNHYSEEIILNDVAKNVFLQPNYLTTLFKKETGMGFVYFLNRVRIDEACKKMLSCPNMSFAELAGMCGFPSTSYFFTTFKKYTNMTPGEFKASLS